MCHNIVAATLLFNLQYLQSAKVFSRSIWYTKKALHKSLTQNQRPWYQFCLSEVCKTYSSDRKIVVRDDKVLPHLGQGLIRDGVDTELLFRLCENQPELAPSAVAGALAEKLLHLIAGVARVELLYIISF
jgi:hypothetical protein